MAEQPREELRTLLDFAMSALDGARQSIARPIINANNFEIKPALIQMIQTSTSRFSAKSASSISTSARQVGFHRKQAG